jgi:hypothetical protein
VKGERISSFQEYVHSNKPQERGRKTVLYKFGSDAGSMVKG